MDIKKTKMLLINPTLFLLRLNVSLIKTIQFLDRKNQIERQRIIKGLDNIRFQYLSLSAHLDILNLSKVTTLTEKIKINQEFCFHNLLYNVLP